MIIEIVAVAFLASSAAVFVKDHKTSKVVADVSSRLTSLELKLDADAKKAESLLKNDLAVVETEVKKVL